MDQEKIGKFILELRKKNNLTQKEFADKLGVTYQAVSKWENGKNIPDIAILKQICEEFDANINELLGVRNKQKNKYYSLVIFIILILLILVFVLQLNHSQDNNFEFKTIEANCDNFNISGSIAYNDSKSSIYISSVEYCGINDNTKYKDIECSLYDVDNNKEVKIDNCNYDITDSITLDEYLKNVKFNINNYESLCKNYSTNYLRLEINATDKNGRVTSYKIPLRLKNNCN